MLDVLQTGEDKLAVNRGLRMNKQQDNKMMTYQESKKLSITYTVNDVCLKIKFILNHLILYLNQNILNYVIVLFLL